MDFMTKFSIITLSILAISYNANATSVNEGESTLCIYNATPSKMEIQLNVDGENQIMNISTLSSH
jgi:hypothetical protein